MGKALPIRCHCGRFFEISTEFAGRRVECPGCGVLVEVPNLQADVPSLKGTAHGEEHKFSSGSSPEFENVLDRPMSEVIADQKREGELCDSGLEVAPQKDERFCPTCRSIVSIEVQRCGDCESVFCLSCLEVVEFGHSKCPHCQHRFFRREPKEGWPRKMRSEICPHCHCLPVERTDSCYSCGQPLQEKSSSWPVAPSVGRSGTLQIGSNRTIRQHGRRAIAMGLGAGVGGGLSMLLGLEMIEPATSLGGSAWKILTFLVTVIVAGRGFQLAWTAYHQQGEETWSAIVGMIACGLVFIPLFLPVWILDSISASQQQESLSQCTENLEAVASALRDYRRRHEGRLPPLDRDLFFSALTELDSSDRLRCPGRPDLSLGYAVHEDTHPLPDALARARGRQFPLVWDRDGNHEGIYNVLFLDGHTERVESDEFTQLRRDAQKSIDEFSRGEGGW